MVTVIKIRMKRLYYRPKILLILQTCISQILYKSGYTFCFRH